MSKFIIPKGTDYNFTIKVMEDDSYLPQDVEYADEDNSYLQITLASDGSPVGPQVPLAKFIEDDVPDVVAVADVTTLSVLEVQEAKYTITINGTAYVADYSGLNYTVTATNTASAIGDVVATFVTTGPSVYDVSVDKAIYDVVGNSVVLNTATTPTNFNISFNYGEPIAIVATVTTPVTNAPADTDAIALELRTKIGNALPDGVTVSGVTNQVILTNAEGLEVGATYTSNIVLTDYVKGSIAVEGGSTFYADNGFLKGTVLAVDSATMDVYRGDAVDGYPLKSLYQGVITVAFLPDGDGVTTDTKTALLNEVYVTYSGV